MKPFSQLPIATLIPRFAIVALPAAFLGFYLSGVATLDESLYENERFIGRNDFQTYSQTRSNLSRATQHALLTLRDWAAPPEGCRDGDVGMGSVRAAQCSAFSGRLFKRFMIVLMPFWYFLITFGLFFLWVKVLYGNAKLASSHNVKSFELARVTQPAEAPRDAFSWISGCAPISVQRQNGDQVVVYCAGNVATPLSGERLAIFVLSVPLVGKRRFGILYAPHMAIVHGV